MTPECARCECRTFCREKNWLLDDLCDDFMEELDESNEGVVWNEFSYRKYTDTILSKTETEKDDKNDKDEE